MRMDTRRFGRLLAAALVATGVAGILASAPGVLAPGASAQQTGGSAEALSYRLDALDAELAAIRARLGLGPSAPGGAPAALSGSRVTELEGEVRRLTAMVEEMQNRQRRIAEEAARRFSDVEFRLTELEGGDIGVLQPVPPLGGLGELPASATGQIGVGPSGQAGTQVAAVSVAEQGDLDRAAADVRQGRYDQAEQRLRAFLHDYPASPLTGDAWYWLGESQSTRGNHADAARSFLQGYNADRRGTRAAQNLYRLGVTLGRLGQVGEACLTLREVSAQFPAASDVVDEAEAEADALACG